MILDYVLISKVSIVTLEVPQGVPSLKIKQNIYFLSKIIK
jgi:hypothetical protein